MRKVIYAKPLASWTIDGVTYQAPEQIVRRAPPEADGHYNLRVGHWGRLPDKGGLDDAMRMKRRNDSPSAPSLQRFELKVVEEPDAETEVEALLGGLTVERDPETAKREKAAADENERLREKLAKQDADAAKLRSEIAKLKADAKPSDQAAK